MTQKINLFNAFTRILLCTFIITISNSCTKLNEVISPSLVNQVVGKYVGKIFRIGGQDAALPIVSPNGDTFDIRFEITKGTTSDAVNLDLVLNQKENGVKSETKEQYIGLMVEKGIDGEILLKENKVTQATVKGKKLEISFELEGLKGSFIAERP